MPRLSVTEAAERLNVSAGRIHQRIQDGSLAAERVGTQWSIDEHDVERLLRAQPKPGRPMSPRSAWTMILLAHDEATARAVASPPARSVARKRVNNLVDTIRALADQIEAGNYPDAHTQFQQNLAHAVRRRADRHLYRAASMDLPDLRDDARIHLAGVSLPESNISAGDIVEGYVRSKDLETVVDDYLLTPVDAHGQPNVILHALPAEVDYIFRDDLEVSLDSLVRSPLVRAADLSEHEGPREQHEGVRSLAELHALLLGRGAHALENGNASRE